MSLKKKKTIHLDLGLLSFVNPGPGVWGQLVGWRWGRREDITALKGMLVWLIADILKGLCHGKLANIWSKLC